MCFAMIQGLKKKQRNCVRFAPYSKLENLGSGADSGGCVTSGSCVQWACYLILLKHVLSHV